MYENTRYKIVTRIISERDITEKFANGDKFKAWVYNQIMDLERIKHIKAIDEVDLGRNEKERGMYIYNKEDWQTLYICTLERYDNLGKTAQMNTDEMKAILKSKNINLKNYSARISAVRKELHIEPIANKKPQVFRKEDAEKIIDRIIETYRKNTDEDKAIEIYQNLLIENDNLKQENTVLKQELDNVKLLVARQKIELEEREQQISNLISKLSEHKKSRRLIDVILGKGKNNV